ncbi:MAG: hypothetical protein GXP31_13655 [Kiritimatiellaeota bacterium]|nr:hypothetical protein [Kiritimatiellota bacterium]
MTGCSTETRHQWLTVFFEGVPPLRSEAAAARAAQPVVAAPDDTSRVESTKPVIVTHEPYGERKCRACHASGFSQKLNEPVPELCFSCHNRFQKTPRFAHAPVEAGACLLCHEPHDAKYPNLLRRAGQAVCAECHDPDDTASVKAHAAIGNTACQSCHNPHGGERSYYLRNGTAGATQ